jgi:ATP-dependent RNA helicase DDX5/DBP2
MVSQGDDYSYGSYNKGGYGNDGYSGYNGGSKYKDDSNWGGGKSWSKNDWSEDKSWKNDDYSKWKGGSDWKSSGDSYSYSKTNNGWDNDSYSNKNSHSQWESSKTDSWPSKPSADKWSGDWSGYKKGNDNTGSWNNNSGGWSSGRQSTLKLEQFDFSSATLVEFVRNFYTPCESVELRSVDEVDRIRAMHNINIISGDDVPKVVVSFEECGLPEYLLKSVYAQFGPNARPTPIQMQGVPIALSGRDLIGIAETGSGKTLSYIAPAIVHINAQAPAEAGQGPICLIVVPTRELCTQIAEEANKFTKAVEEMGGVACKIATAFGGVRKNEQLWLIRESLDILIAAPGRLIDFLSCGEVSLLRTTYLVLDEADQMLDMGFEPQLRQILSQVRPDKQCLMYSATWPKEVRKLALTVFKEAPVHIRVGGDEELRANHQIEQVVMFVQSEKEKQEKLFSEVLPQLYLDKEGNRVDDAKMLIFCNTRVNVDYLTKKMREEGVDAVAIHSGKEQTERTWIFERFRHGDTKVLVATNLMGRGVDIPAVQIVLNYDLPDSIEDYVHRIGRTARGMTTANCKAISFMGQKNTSLARELVHVMAEADQDIPDWLREMQNNPWA